MGDAGIGASKRLLADKSKSTVFCAKSDFARAMTELGLDGYRNYLTALSGGADSSALALLAQQYANSSGKLHHAVIIDHGLREDLC